eukprot:gnl/Chilomastix_cuspidata/128.p1 GENE.gnl/Chilomastix_cuspidata/128~~gnl/Chilomastix_cuspidata/128.p1  ORF type:complete len:611 (-),score=311.63 gnl/Chilomastix_cuspidata/128:3147-4979(-)
MQLSADNKAVIARLANPKFEAVLAKAIALFEPRDVLVCDDSEAMQKLIAERALAEREETKLATPGHTVHFDSPLDQARDKAHTATLLPPGQTLSRGLNVVEREAGLAEVQGYMKGSMRGRTMICAIYCLGPRSSVFSKAAVQFTDSFYVAHSQNILYRPGFENLATQADKDDFYYFFHSTGPHDEHGMPADIEHRRIYIDPTDFAVYSYANSYAGNCLACKKLALRLAIYQANQSDWLTEHMFLAGFRPPKGGPVTYIAGAYPSACGKTSTAMSNGSEIVGDDIVYIRNVDGTPKVVNIEQGCFGIIKDVCRADDPVIFEALTTPREIIYSNVLVGEDKKPYWTGMGEPAPSKGMNFQGPWEEGKGPMSHPNSRYTLRISELPNASSRLHDPEGVDLSAIFYGGRDASINVPVLESISWAHGVYMGSCIESETTAATLGAAGVRASSPMANMDFLIVPLARYISNHLAFGARLGDKVPRVFGTNYFLRGEDGKFLNTKLDKQVWISWAVGRVRGQYGGVRTPIGVLPKYEDLRDEFARQFDGRVYTREEYDQQFSLRVGALLEKHARMGEQYAAEPSMPAEWGTFHDEYRRLLEGIRAEHGDLVPPSVFE